MSVNDDSGPEPEAPQPGRFQFKIVTLMLATLLISIFAALFGEFFRRGGDSDIKARLVLLTLMAPIGLVVLFAAIRFLMTSRRRGRRKKW